MAKSMMDQDMLKVLYSEEQIRTRVQEMGDTLYEQFKDRNPLFLGVLKGSFIFMADIWRPKNAIDGRYLWLPMKWEGDQIILEWKDEWTLDDL
jgi:hypoxanthine-guanine phosphoribosyltransferase